MGERENGNDLWFSQKREAFGGNVQFLSAPDGTPLWVSEVEPGSTPDITAARIHVLPALHKAAAQGLPTLADKGYIGAGIGIRIPVRRPKGRSEQALHIDIRMTNALIRHIRALGEPAAAELKERWRALKHITLSPAASATSPAPRSFSSSVGSDLHRENLSDGLTGSQVSRWVESPLPGASASFILVSELAFGVQGGM